MAVDENEAGEDEEEADPDKALARNGFRPCEKTRHREVVEHHRESCKKTDCGESRKLRSTDFCW